MSCYHQALHTERINLSPFTQDIRVWGAYIEISLIYLRVFLTENLLSLNGEVGADTGSSVKIHNKINR